MKVSSLSAILALPVIITLSIFSVRDSGANGASPGMVPDSLDAPVSLGVPLSGSAPVSFAQALTATQRTIPASTLALINRCNCFTSVTSWQVSPIASPAEVFSSPDILFAILDLDVQLPWAGVGEVPTKPLVDRILRSGVDALNQVLLLGNRAGGIRVGLYSWLHPTAPDFCSGETLHLLYFPAGGQLVAFRYDSSRDC